MTSTEFRAKGIEAMGKIDQAFPHGSFVRSEAYLVTMCDCMVEIAAQLAELNERLGRITAGKEHVFTEKAA